MKSIIERAYQLINEPINPNLRTPVELIEAVNYEESNAGEDLVYFKSPDTDRGLDGIYSADANGSITFHKIGLKSTTAISFSSVQTKLETVLLDELMASKDLSALASCKQNLILSLDNYETKLVCDVVLSVAGQEVTKASGEDILDVIIKMKQLISNYSNDYVLLVAPDVMDEIETYDKANVGNFNYKMSIFEELSKLGVKKIIKVLGVTKMDDVEAPILANGKSILVGRNSKLLKQKPISLCRRKFTKEIAEYSGAGEGAVRLINVVPTPYIVNADGKNTLGYGVFGYESLAVVLLNYRAVAWSGEILI